jgi:hypothetical protein
MGVLNNRRVKLNHDWNDFYLNNNNGTLTNNTNYGFIYFYNKSLSYSNTFLRKCVEVSRQSNSNMRVYLPVETCDFMGYTYSNIRKYINILNKAGFNFRYILREKIGENPFYNLEKLSYKNELENLLITENKFYIVDIIIDKTKCNKYESYISFVLLRYLYSYYYFDIPETLINLKRNIKDLSTWQLILLALFKRKYYYYYSILNPDDSNCYNLKNMSNKELILSRSVIKRALNPSFCEDNIVINKIDTDLVSKFIIEKKYKKLSNYAKSFL